MTDLDVHLKIAGAALGLLALLHLGFPHRFDWTRELASLSLLNRQMMQVHILFIMLTVAFFAGLCLFGSAALLSPSPLGRWVAGGLTGFWAARLYCQLMVYDGELWRGKRFETTVHVVFTLLWTYLVAVFSTLLWRQFCP